MRKHLLTLLGAAAVLAALGTPAMAAHLPPHEHFLVSASGEKVRIGPSVCDNPQAIAGFDQFHERVHANPAFQAAIDQSPNEEQVFEC